MPLLLRPNPVTTHVVHGTCLARSEALALFAAEPYAGAPLTNLAAHLTNTCRLRRAAERGAGRAGEREADGEDAEPAVSDDVGVGAAGRGDRSGGGGLAGVRQARGGDRGRADDGCHGDQGPGAGDRSARGGSWQEKDAVRLVSELPQARRITRLPGMASCWESRRTEQCLLHH